MGAGAPSGPGAGGTAPFDPGDHDGGPGSGFCTKIDFVFVIDNSGSMVDEQAQLTLAYLEAAQIQIGQVEGRAGARREIGTHDSDQMNRREVPGGEREIGGGAAEHFLHAARRGLDGIETEGADDGDPHVTWPPVR